MSGSDDLFDDDVFVALAESLAPAPSPAGARDRLLAAATRGSRRFAPFVPALERLFNLGADAVQAFLDRATRAASWVAGPLEGVELLHLDGGPRVAGADCGLVRLAPGTPFPDHDHLGNEAVLILQGRYRDVGGTVYHPGDLHEMRPGQRHSYVVLPDQPCIVAVVLFEGIDVGGRVVKVGP